MKIFISYRRSDSKVFTGRIMDRLAAVFRRGDVFRDIEDIPAGKDFRDVLRGAVNLCNIMLVIIGPEWARTTHADGTKRLFDPNDFVRFEVETGLKRKGLTVIPVLVLNASMPKAEELPPELQELIYRNAVIVRDDPDFPTDMQRLVSQIRRARPVETALKWTGIAAVAILLLALSALFLFNRNKEPVTNVTLPVITEVTNAPTALPTKLPTDIPTEPPVTEPANNQTPAPYSIGTSGQVLKSFTLYQDADENSLILRLVQPGTSVEVVAQNMTGDWMQVSVEGQQGWSKSDELQLPPPLSVTRIAVGKGYGARSNAWQVYFTSPSENPNPATDLGIEVRLATAINKVQKTLDIAAYEFDNKVVVQSVLDAHRRGVTIRIVADDENGLENPKSAFQQFAEAGIPIVTDERQSLMHNKFMILDGKTVWTGSWNYTESGTYKSNDNALAFDSPDLVALYQNEFDRLFVKREFSADASPSPINETVAAGIPVEVYFSPHDSFDQGVMKVIRSAHTSIYFMTFSFTDTELSALLQQKVHDGIKVNGIFEKVGAGVGTSQLVPLFCANVDVRTDGSKYFLHHKVIIIDNAIIITGSANYSMNAWTANNENTIIVYDPNLASVYMEEFNRQWAIAETPTSITCP